MIKMWESCLSVPNLVGKVNRHKHITVSFLNEEGIQKVRVFLNYIIIQIYDPIWVIDMLYVY